MAKNKMKLFDWITFVLTTLGGINWGIVGIFNINLISRYFARVPVIETILYILIGVVSIITLFRMIWIQTRS